MEAKSNMVKRICIMGGGNGAFCAAADLSLRGFEVALYEQERFAENISELMKTKTISYESPTIKQDVNIYKATTDLADALEGVDLIMPIAPAYAQVEVATNLAPHLKPGHKIVLTPGSTGGCLVFAKTLRALGKLDGVKLSEMHTLPYATRKIGPTKVWNLLDVTEMFFAAFPAKDNKEMFDLVKEVYPCIYLVHDVLETSLNNGNAVSHPAPMVLNAGKIEYYGKHNHYKEGVTPSVARVNNRIDQERLAISDMLGYEHIDACERLYRMGYSPKRDNLYDAYQASTEVFMKSPGPDTLGARYLTEDTPCSLVVMSHLGKMLGIETPVMNAVIELAGALREENYMETGRTLEQMGLNDMSKDEMLQFLQEGYR